MYGLIIKKKWLDLIVSGKKVIEIRGSDTKRQNETIYLLESEGKVLWSSKRSCYEYKTEFNGLLCE